MGAKWGRTRPRLCGSGPFLAKKCRFWSDEADGRGACVVIDDTSGEMR